MLLVGVTALAATTAFHGTGPLQNGAIVVASWSNGRRLVLCAAFGARNRVDLNLYPPTNTYVQIGDGTELIRNALQYR